MRDPTSLRERYGEVFVVELPDGSLVPFRLLSLSDYFKYSKSLEAGILPRATIENEIFEKCVLDECLVDELFKQKAGTPTVVADTILQYSAPQNQNELVYFLNYNRQVVDNILYQIVYTICMGFPYTPDDVLSKDIHEIMFLLALAEKKLLETGMLQEPLDFSGGQTPEQPKKPKPKVDLSKLKQAYQKQGQQEYNVHELKKQNKPLPRKVVEDETPQIEHETDEQGNIVVSSFELKQNNQQPLEDEGLQMMKEAQSIFGDYLEKMQKGERIEIKSEDERIAEAKRRLEENRRKFQQRLKKK